MSQQPINKEMLISSMAELSLLLGVRPWSYGSVSSPLANLSLTI